MIELKDLRVIIDDLVDVVVKDKIEAQIEIALDRVEISVQPWRPYETKCPYGKENT